MVFGSLFKNIFYIVLMLMLLPLIPVLTGAISTGYQRYFDPRTAVAVVPIKGLLYESTALVKQLTTYFKDPSIKAILLKIECPGSASGTGQAIYLELQALKKEHQKPVIAVVENICASGGYYIACAADHIIATPSALIGSIGVRFNQLAQFQLKEFIEQFKIKYEPSSAGDYKMAGDMFIAQKPEHKKMLQVLLDDTYEQFIEDVAASRKLSPSTSSEWANGKVFTGRIAQKLGLIDQIGSQTAAVAAIKEKALIEGEIRWIYPAGKGGLLRMLTGENDEDGGFLSSLINHCCTLLEQRYCQPRLQ